MGQSMIYGEIKVDFTILCSIFRTLLPGVTLVILIVLDRLWINTHAICTHALIMPH